VAGHSARIIQKLGTGEQIVTGLLRDILHSLRQLRKSPGFAAAAIVTLALGIGANTAVFSALNALLFRMLPVQDPQNLYTIVLVNGGTQPPNTNGTGHGNTSFSYPVYEALRQQSRVFTDLIAHVPLSFGKVPVRYGSTPTVLAGEEVSGNFFSGLGVSMLRGMGFTESDERNHSPIAVISYSFWSQTFARDPDVLGKTLYVKGVPFSIVGVTTPSFYGVNPGNAVDFWIPLQNRPELNAWGVPATGHEFYGSPRWWDMPILARLRPGITPAQAEQVLQPTFWHAASEGIGTLDPKRWPAHLGFEPIRGIGSYAKRYRAAVEIMMVLVGLVLLIACTNVASLILARNAARQREFAVRMAIGARPSRLFRQLLAESLLLVSGGAMLGWTLAIGATRALAFWAGIRTGLAPDRHVLLFTLGIASLAALVFSFVPLRSTLKIAVEQELKGAGAGATQSRSRVRNSHATVAAQIAMCVALLVASGLSVRTLLNYERQNLGMQAEKLLVFDVDPQGFNNNEQAVSFYHGLLDRLKALPGVQAASLTRVRPGSGWETTEGIKIDGVQLLQPSGSHIEVDVNFVGADFFRTLGIPVLRGRELTDADTPTSPPTAVVNEAFEKRFFKDGALGHRVDSAGAEIVGVVKDTNYYAARQTDKPSVYYPLSQSGMRGEITVEVRAIGDPMALLPEMQHAVHDLDPDLALQRPMTQAAQFAETYVRPRLFARLATGFGVLAVFLVATGLYGTLAYRVQRRRNEIGVRMALGAHRTDVVSMILRECLLMVLAGFVVGLPLAVIVARLLRSQLYDVAYLDPASFAFAVAITLFVALAAALLPARRASSVDPMVALRYE
jgi:predicted permease